ncbi:MBL fold metallo-hydrolase [Sphingobium sp. SCG-1]|uniref:MBL fold metallo-hydrolase n=1 Tax=Sphingobium sp. SCG-1 TaxID=2072936 RepID=UPI0016710D1D|nr:MBL fold metallo-hydrolase [Sphingobium sp. SCG-1]
MASAGELMASKTWQLGQVRITRVIEIGPLELPVGAILDTDTETVLKHDWLRPFFATDDGKVLINVQAFVIEAGGRTIIVDTCIGNDKPRGGALYNMRNEPFLERLGDAGFTPEQIDVVMCTHLHVDHVGWNTRFVEGAWVPTFPNARYLFERTEYAHAIEDRMGDQEATYQDSVKPIVDAGLHLLVVSDHKLCDEVRLSPTPGHTPGHCAVIIESQGQRAIITGDMIHHPIQVAEVDACSHVDTDKAQARQSRRDLFAQCEGTGDLLLGTHFPDPTSVRILRAGDGWRAEPA